MEFKRLTEKKSELEYYKKTDQISDNDLELLAEIDHALQLLQPDISKVSEMKCTDCKSLNVERDYGLGELYCYDCEKIVGK